LKLALAIGTLAAVFEVGRTETLGTFLMFDNVYDDKLWKKNRDATGLKGGLTEKVSMGDEFKRFHEKKKTVEAAKALLKQITLYEKQLKDKHAKEKYYTKLLKVVQDQKAAIEVGIEDAEQPRDNQPRDKEGNKVDMDALVDEVVKREKEHARQYEDTTGGDPNVPAFHGEARRVYLKLTKEFKTVEGKIKAERVTLTDLLQKCKALETSPNLKAKPDSALIVVKKILETLEKIETKTADLQGDFVTEAQVVRKEEGATAGATKELDKLMARLTEEMGEIADTNRACRVSLKAVLQSLGDNPQAEQIMRRLHV
jgi:hypothetical protein